MKSGKVDFYAVSCTDHGDVCEKYQGKSGGLSHAIVVVVVVVVIHRVHFTHSCYYTSITTTITKHLRL
jgi:hypothetical protein